MEKGKQSASFVGVNKYNTHLEKMVHMDLKSWAEPEPLGFAQKFSTNQVEKVVHREHVDKKVVELPIENQDEVLIEAPKNRYYNKYVELNPQDILAKEEKADSNMFKDVLGKFGDIDIMSLLPLLMSGGDSSEIFSKLLKSIGKDSSGKDNMLGSLAPFVPLVMGGLRNNAPKESDPEKVINLKDYKQL